MSVSRPSGSSEMMLYRCCNAQPGALVCEKRDIHGNCCRCSDNSLRNPAFVIERPGLEVWSEYCDVCRQSLTEEFHVGPTTRIASPSFFQSASNQNITIQIPLVDENNTIGLFNPTHSSQHSPQSQETRLILPIYPVDDTGIVRNCKICLVNVANVVFFPCRHCCTCVSCVGIYMRACRVRNSGCCPICRQEVLNWVDSPKFAWIQPNRSGFIGPKLSYSFCMSILLCIGEYYLAIFEYFLTNT